MDINKLLLNHGISKVNLSNNGNTSTSPITNFTATNGDGGVVLSWANPTDANFYGVRIQRKLGSYPTSHTDGTTVFSGVATTFTDTGVTQDEVYYYRAFTYTASYIFNNNVSQQVTITAKTSLIYTVIIDTTNSNPETSVTYADDAIGMTAGSSNWDSIYPFNEIKPVLFKNGAVVSYLNPNNFTQTTSNVSVDITSGNAGDVMIQFPKVYMYTRKVGNLIYVSLSQTKVNANYKCFAHTKLGVERDFSYIGAYLGSLFDWDSSGVLYSISGKIPDSYETIADYRYWAENKGVGYQLISYYQLLMIQVLYLIKYKNLNSQAAIGQGYVGGTTKKASGSADLQGMTYGTQSNLVNMKLFGIEDLWGNLYSWIDGIVLKDNNTIAIGDGNYNDFGIDYTEYAVTSGLEGYITSVMGGNETAFITSGVSGSSSTYFCDRGAVLTQEAEGLIGAANIGGDYDNGGQCGIFAIEIGDPYTSIFDEVGTRLAYL